MRTLLIACFATIGVMTAQTTPAPKPEITDTVSYEVIQVSGADGAELKEAESAAAAANAKLQAIRNKIRGPLGQGSGTVDTASGKFLVTIDVQIWGEMWALKTTRRRGPL
jgi:hypothetical protein